MSAIEMDLKLSLTEPGRRFELQLAASLPGSGITAIYGDSGCGKTTLLRCLAGLQPGVQGHLRVHGETWLDAGTNLPAHRRPVGYVFQEANLFPHLTVAGNLDYASKRAAPGAARLGREELIALLGLQELLQQSPASLSGGERQRVAIARALLINPRLLLMDEPLAALDSARKREILPYLESLHESLEIPLLYVSHSLEEVARLADHVLVLDQGKIVEQGPMLEVLAQLQSRLQEGEDSGAVLAGTIAAKDEAWHLSRFDFDGGSLWLRDSGEAIGERLRLQVLARDVSLSLTDNSDSSIVNRLPCTVREIVNEQDEAMALVSLELGNSRLVARLSRRSVHELRLLPGMPVWAQIKSVAMLR